MTASRSPSPIWTKSEFPIKVYAMLELADIIFEVAQAVTWLPHGRAFRIHNKDKFINEVVPLFFNQTKIRSFIRQLQLWGFRRQVIIRECDSRGRDDDEIWYHDNFIRGKPEDMKLMVRTKIKSNAGGRGSSEDMRVPNFDALPPLPVCNEQPAAILDIMESVIFKLPNAFGGAHCGSEMPTISHPQPQLLNATAAADKMVVLPRTRTETPYHHQDDAFQTLSPPTFHRSVRNESRFMMQPCVPTMPFMNNHSLQQVDNIEPSPAEHQTSVHGPLRLEESHTLQNNLSDFSLSSLQHDDDLEPLPLMDDTIPGDDFASFIEGAIRQIEC